jgi:hypothetical protein
LEWLIRDEVLDKFGHLAMATIVGVGGVHESRLFGTLNPDHQDNQALLDHCGKAVADRKVNPPYGRQGKATKKPKRNH